MLSTVVQSEFHDKLTKIDDLFKGGWKIPFQLAAAMIVAIYRAEVNIKQLNHLGTKRTMTYVHSEKFFSGLSNR